MSVQDCWGDDIAYLGVHKEVVMKIPRRAGTLLATSVAALLALPLAAVAAPSGGHGGGGGGGESTGSVYSNLVVALRAEDGTPVLKKYEVPGEESEEATVEYVVQPVSYEPVPGVQPTTNPLDGRDVYVIPLQGEWLPPYDGEIPVDEIEPGDPQPQYAMFVEEVELERLNLARTSDDVIADKLAAVEERLRIADEITLDGAGRLTTDGESMDASPEFAAMYQSLMQTGTIPGLPEELAGPPAQVGPFGAWELAAAAIGTAAGKEIPITVDTVEYYNRVIGFPQDGDYTSPWGVDFLRSADPDTGEEMTEGDRFVDYGDFTYNRSETFVGSVTWLDVDKMQWQVDPITDVVDFTNLTNEAVGDRTLEGVTAFAQLADDVRAVIWYYHEHETIPGFYIDPVGVDTTEEQQAAITNPAVDLGTLPADVFLTQPFDMTASLFNPWGGSEIDKARLRVVVDAEADLAEGDLTAVAKEDGQEVPFTEDGGNLVGWWGPEDGFPVQPGYKTSTAFDVTVAGDAEPGAYDVTLELVHVDDPDTVLATDQESTTVNAASPTVLWGDALPKIATQGTAVKLPVSVYSPTDGTADLTLTVQGPGDDPTTDLVEELRAGDVKVYGSDGSDMVPMPMTADDEGTTMTGTWSMPVTQGFTDQTWYLTVTEGALVGNYAVDVALEGGNRLEAATIAVEAPASHGNQPPGAGEDTTAPTVTIEVVGTLGSTATFLLSADEPDVTYQVRLAKDDVKPEWETTTEEKWTYEDLEPGIYSFEVKATDAAGNTSGRYSKTWKVPEEAAPATAPETRVVKGPRNNEWLPRRKAVYRVRSNEETAVYRVALNGKFLGRYAGPRVVVRGLRAGRNRVKIRAVANGKVDPTPAVRVVNVPRSVAAIRHTRGWWMRRGPAHLFGRYAQTRQRGQAFRVGPRKVKRIALVAAKGPRHGKVHVFFKGRRLTQKPIRLHARTGDAKVVIPVRTFARPRRGVVTVKVASRGRVVRLGGIGVVGR